jgi:hypothetical protein
MTTHRSDKNPHESKTNEPNSQASGESEPDRDSHGPRGDREDRDGRRPHRGHRSRKERVLHTRISEQLAEDIREFAEDLRVPASNLVRNVLEEVFTVVNSVSGDVGGLMDDLVEEAEGVRDRIRREMRSRRSSTRSEARSSRRSSRGRSDRGHQDVEEELRRDEERESRPAFDKKSERAPEAESTPPGGGTKTAKEARSAAELFPNILGWQPLVLNKDFDCGRCKCVLHAGDSAFLGLGQAGLTDTALCGRCASSRAQRRAGN